MPQQVRESPAFLIWILFEHLKILNLLQPEIAEIAP
jgi:hypothetical protein